MKQLPMVFGLLFALGCGGAQHYVTTGTERSAGADANIVAEVIEGGNVMVTIEVEHLTPPERVTSGATAYVAWFTAPDAEPVKAGALGYDADDRVGRLRATNPNKRFVLTITAEANAAVVAPSEYIVIRQGIQATQ